MSTSREAGTEGMMFQDNDTLEEVSERAVKSRALVIAGSLKNLDPILQEKVGQLENAADE
jgi:hypothetical protein